MSRSESAKEEAKLFERVDTVRTQYQAVLDQRQTKFDAHFSDGELAKLHRAAHGRLLEFERVSCLASGRREYRIFELGARLLGDGLCQVASGNYVSAFFCLRSFLELSSAAVRFSAFEYELREWELGRRDIVWSRLMDEESGSGIYSKPFAAIFFPQLSEEARHYFGLAKRVYRECSQYVHSNPSAHAIDTTDVDRASLWFELFESAMAAVMFLFFIRYHSEFADVISGDEELKSIFHGEVGHFAGVAHAIESGGVE